MAETVKPVRVGMIGAGGIAGTHIEYLKKIPGVQVTAACDIRDEALDATGKKYEIPRLFKTYQEVIALPDIDAVSVCTPNYFHAEPTIAALRAGKHVMVEKPMAMTPQEAQAMVDAARAANRVLVIGFQFRYHPSSQMLKRAVDAGQFGKILYVRCQALRRRGIPNWGVFGQKKLQGGGPMIDIGVHILEAAHFVIGKPKPVAASGACYTYMGDKPSTTVSPWPNWDWKTYTVEDLATGYIRFENGATLVMECSFVAHIEKNVFNYTIMGEKAGGTFDPPNVFTDWSGTMFNLTPGFLPRDEQWNAKMSDWIEAIRTGKQPTAPGEDGVVVQKMLNGIYESAAQGKEIAIT